MKLKSISIALMWLPLTCGVSKGMEQQRYLTDGRVSQQLATYNPSNELGTYQESSIRGTQQQVNNNVNFSGGAQFPIKCSKSFDCDQEHVQLEGVVRYVGHNPYTIGNFQSYLQKCVADYTLNMALKAPKELNITPEDTMYTKYFGEFLSDILFYYNPSDDKAYKNITISTPEFSKMFESNVSPYKDFTHRRSPLFYTCIYYFGNPSAKPVSIAKPHKGYNNLKFELLGYSETEDGIGTNLNFGFDSKLFPIRGDHKDPSTKSNLVILDTTSNNTLLMFCSFYMMMKDMYLTVDLSKLDKATYGMKLTFGENLNNRKTDEIIKGTFSEITTQMIKVKITK